MNLIDKRGGIALFKVVIPAVTTLKKGQTVVVTKARVEYQTFPEDQINYDDARKTFKTLGEARATMPPIPNTSPPTPGRADCPHNQPGYKQGNFKAPTKRK